MEQQHQRQLDTECCPPPLSSLSSVILIFLSAGFVFRLTSILTLKDEAAAEKKIIIRTVCNGCGKTAGLPLALRHSCVLRPHRHLAPSQAQRPSGTIAKTLTVCSHTAAKGSRYAATRPLKQVAAEMFFSFFFFFLDKDEVKDTRAEPEEASA